LRLHTTAMPPPAVVSQASSPAALSTHIRPPTTAAYADLGRLMTLMTGDEKHDASATSTLDVIWVLYHHVLRVDRAHPDDGARDRFLLSKGHGPMAYYAVLAAHGFFDVKELVGFGAYDSRLGYHPDRTLVPGVEISSGSLGHGLALGVGTALGLRLAHGSVPQTFVLVGDAELEEGSNAEAIEYAGRVGLGALTVVVIDNASASLGWPGGIAARYASAGWATSEVDGRDHGALKAHFTRPHDDRPLAIVASVEPKR
jgi:transketolase